MKLKQNLRFDGFTIMLYLKRSFILWFGGGFLCLNSGVNNVSQTYITKNDENDQSISLLANDNIKQENITFLLLRN